MSGGKIERRLAAILAADVVGYSRLMGVDEVGTLRALQAHRREFIDPVVAAHHGRLVKTTGDGLLLEFASVVDAVACGVAVQRGMLARNAGVAEDKRIMLRIGINVGDIIIEGGDIFGDGVNVAARLEALCEPGGLCISRSANEQVRDKLALAFADLGEQVVKNISRAVGVFGLAAADIAKLPEYVAPDAEPDDVAVPQEARPATPRRVARWPMAVATLSVLIALAVGTWWTTRATAPTVAQTGDRRLSLLVLAFSSAGTDAAQDQRAAQLTHDVTQRFSELPGIPVVSAEAAAMSATPDTTALGRKLDVHFVLAGAVRSENDHLVTTASLTETSHDRKVWSVRIELPENPKTTATMVERIVHDAHQAAIDAEVARAERERPGAWDARDNYLAAQISILQPLTQANRLAQLALIDKAHALDPGFAPAIFELAALRAVVLRNDWSENRAADIEAANRAIDALIAARPRDTEVLAVKASLQAAQGNLDQALTTNRLITEIAPDRWEPYRDIGGLLFEQGKYQDSLASLREARKRLPTNFGAYDLDGQIAAALLAVGQYSRAADTAGRAIVETRGAGVGALGDRLWLVQIAAQSAAGKDEEARATLARYLAAQRLWRTLAQVQTFRANALTPHLADGLRKAGMAE